MHELLLGRVVHHLLLALQAPSHSTRSVAGWVCTWSLHARLLHHASHSHDGLLVHTSHSHDGLLMHSRLGHTWLLIHTTLLGMLVLLGLMSGSLWLRAFREDVVLPSADVVRSDHLLHVDVELL